MPVRDFGLEAIKDENELILIDTSALFWPLDRFMPDTQRELYRNAADSASDRRKLSVEKGPLLRAIDFNTVMALFLDTYPQFKVTGDVVNEYRGVEMNYARKITAPLIKKGLIREYNDSVEALKEQMRERTVCYDDPAFKGYFEWANERLKENDPEVSEVDQRIALLALRSSMERDTGVISNDKRLAGRCLSLKETLDGAKGNCNLYHINGSDHFRKVIL